MCSNLEDEILKKNIEKLRKQCYWLSNEAFNDMIQDEDVKNNILKHELPEYDKDGYIIGRPVWNNSGTLNNSQPKKNKIGDDPTKIERPNTMSRYELDKRREQIESNENVFFIALILGLCLSVLVALVYGFIF